MRLVSPEFLTRREGIHCKALIAQEFWVRPVSHKQPVLWLCSERFIDTVDPSGDFIYWLTDRPRSSRLFMEVI